MHHSNRHYTKGFYIEKVYLPEKPQYEPVCSHFGCGKHLSLIQQLAGKYCTAHAGERVELTGVSCKAIFSR